MSNLVGKLITLVPEHGPIEVKSFTEYNSEYCEIGENELLLVLELLPGKYFKFLYKNKIFRTHGCGLACFELAKE